MSTRTYTYEDLVSAINYGFLQAGRTGVRSLSENDIYKFIATLPPKVDEQDVTNAAIYLEENNIAGDTMIEMNHDLDDIPEEKRGSIYLHDLLAGFASLPAPDPQQVVKTAEATTPQEHWDKYSKNIGNSLSDITIMEYEYFMKSMIDFADFQTQAAPTMQWVKVESELPPHWYSCTWI